MPASHSKCYHIINREASPNSHALFAIDEQRIHFLLHVALQLGLDFEQLLMLGLGLLQLAMQHSNRILELTHLLHQL